MLVLLLSLTSADAQVAKKAYTTYCGATAPPAGSAAACDCWYAPSALWWSGDGADWAAVDTSVSPYDVTGSCFELTSTVNAITNHSARHTIGRYLERQGRQYAKPDDSFLVAWVNTPAPWVADQSLMSMDEGEAITGPLGAVSFTPTIPFEGMLTYEVRVDGMPVVRLVTDGGVPNRGYLLDENDDGWPDLVVQIDGNDTWIGYGPLHPADWLLPPS